jgi:hypothetical protein
MTFGSILSATDPVAVASLLEEVGAPPRLKVGKSFDMMINRDWYSKTNFLPCPFF